MEVLFSEDLLSEDLFSLLFLRSLFLTLFVSVFDDEKLKKEKRIELKRKRYLDKINDQSKIAELDVFKPSLNIGAMRIEDKVARFFQSSQGVNDDAGTEFTQDSGLANSGFGTTEHENFSLQEGFVI